MTALRTLLNVVDARVAALRADPRKSPGTVVRSSCTRDKLAPLLEQVLVDEVRLATLLHLRDRIAQLERAPAGRPTGERLAPRTVNGYMGELRAAWNWARARELVDRDWPRGIEPLPRGPRRKRPYTDDEVRRLVGWIQTHASQWYPLACLLADTGRRVGALIRLRGRDVDRAELTITVRDKGRGGQGADVACVPVPRETMALLPAVGADDYLFPRRSKAGRREHAYSGSLLRAVRRGLIAIGVQDHERLDLHSMRRAFCSSAERSGVPADVGRRVTGHRTRAMWEHYQAETVGDDLHDVVRRVRARRFGDEGEPPAPEDLRARVVAAACAYTEDLDDPGASATDSLAALRAAVEDLRRAR